MTDLELYNLLNRIDNGYFITEKENALLSRVKRLDLRGFQIDILPKSIDYLPNLQELYLRDTLIKELPECIWNLKGLRNINLRNTQIKHLSESIGKLTSLQNLCLKETEICTLPESIVRMPSIRILDLSDTRIMELPENIGNLRSLRILNLSGVKISKLPDSIGNLVGLRRLDLQYTRIKELPMSIESLTGLHRLDLRSSQLRGLPSNIGVLKNLQKLYLNDTQINKLPDSVGDLNNLTRLDLRNTHISKLPESIGKLTNLQYFSLSNTHISELPTSIGKLTNLQYLSLSNTHISELPANSFYLSNLLSLELSGTDVCVLPESIGCLSSLQNLYLRYTPIRKLPESIGKLTYLKVLSLRGTQICDLPNVITNLSNLELLSLRNTRIHKLPESIFKLTSLQFLYLSGLHITELPEVIGNLKRLRFLDLSNTKINKLPESTGNLIDLQSLDLGKTQLIDLPECIGKLRNLRKLYINDTQVRELPIFLMNLEYLETLDISRLTLTELPKFIYDMGMHYICEDEDSSLLSGCYINNLKLLTQPISLFLQPRELIADYYQQPHIPINEAKIIFLGSEGVGKTHTIERILNDNRKISVLPQETPGISITFKVFQDDDISYRINFWDFGGQEIMHAMHRCFLTDRTSYVIVVSTRFGDVNRQARYWLKSIENFANNAPVLVFVNVWSEGINYGLDERSLRFDFPNITEVIRCSAKDADECDFSKLTKAICCEALKADSISMEFPLSWERVRQHIIELGQKGTGKYYISLFEYRKICKDNGIINEAIQNWLLDWFNDLGECFSYKMEDDDRTTDQEFKVLNPEWITNAIYIIIREGSDIASDGFINHNGIRNKLNHSDKGTLKNVSYDKKECYYVLNVMRKFRLSYEVPNIPSEFIPALLNEDRPDNLDYIGVSHTINYEMKYSYLPENVIHSLMINMFPYLDRAHSWRKGMVVRILDLSGTVLSAVLDMSKGDNILRIKIFSFGKHAPWELLQEIRIRIQKINKRLKLFAEDYIVSGKNGNLEVISVDKLLKLKGRGVTTYQGTDKDFLIDELLGENFGDAQVKRVREINKKQEDITLSKEHGIASESIDKETVLVLMKEALNQPDRERLLYSMNKTEVTCSMIYEYLISACAQIQSRKEYWDIDEDSRSAQVKTILSNRDIFVRDQTHYGESKTGRRAGEIDIMVMKNATDPLTIIEAMNLSSVEKIYIREHLARLLDNYNPNGLKELFLISYIQKDKDKFKDFWNSYCEYVGSINVGKFKLKKDTFIEKDTEYLFVKSAQVIYSCGNSDIIVHHICMRAGDSK